MMNTIIDHEAVVCHNTNNEDDIGDDDDIPCIICKKHERTEEVVNWIQCTDLDCQCWVHELCLPKDYCFTGDDDDFLCPSCLL